MVDAFDASIHEEKDVIFIFIGGGNPSHIQDSRLYYLVHFLQWGKALITVALAGNGAQTIGTVTNTAPWIVTIAAIVALKGLLRALYSWEMARMLL